MTSKQSATEEAGFAKDFNDPDYQICRTTIEKAMKGNEKVKKLLASIEEKGCTIPDEFIACRKCDGPLTGGFAAHRGDTSSSGCNIPQVIICQNKIRDSLTFASTLAHELVHAYDKCTTRLDTNICAQHACTEVRAASLSGECGMVQEMMRGHMQTAGGHPACVKRRAILSLQGNPSCANVAAESVDAVFEKCYADLRPFTKDEIKRGI